MNSPFKLELSIENDIDGNIFSSILANVDRSEVLEYQYLSGTESFIDPF